MYTYAVADLHGRADLLLKMLERIRDHAGRAQQRGIVFLGDYVDRGPDSAGVIMILRKMQEAYPGSIVCLAGNHEDMLLRALSDRQSFWHWIQNGGQQTLESFGVEHVDDIPRAVLHWLAGLPTLHTDDQRFYVHAGLSPKRPVEPENRKDRLWIRDEFLDANHNFGRHVVHGHTPVEGGPDVRAYRTNLDTKAWKTGRLVAGVFTDENPQAVEFLDVRQDP